VEYSLKQVGIILRNLGMKFGKPYPKDYRRPQDAEEQLKKHIPEFKQKSGYNRVF